MPLVSELLLSGTDRLTSGPHRDRARADAELLFMYLLKKDRAWLIAHASDEVGSDLWEPYNKLLQQRYQGEPIQYIRGETEFYRLTFRVTPDVLIPRPETEHLVEKVVELAPLFSGPRIVDVGTGSGAIAVTLAHEWPDAIVTATDISPSALEVARSNARRTGFADRIRFVQGDLLAPIAGEQFDIVISNPPYVSEADRESLAVEVRAFEPAIALFAGEDGLGIYRRLIPDAFRVLAQGGFIVLEIGHGQETSVGALLCEAGFVDVEFIPDLQRISRVAIGKKT